MLPIDNTTHATIITDNLDMIAVNKHYYFPISNKDLVEHCHGRTIRTCNKIFISLDLKNAPSCTSAVYTNNEQQVKELCKFGLMEVSEYLPPTLIDLRNGTVMLINPTNEEIFLRCLDERDILLTSDSLVSIEIKCFCHLHSSRMTTPIYAEQNCLETENVNIKVNKHMNLRLVSDLINASSIDGKSQQSGYSKLQIPTYLEPLEMSLQSNMKVYDLKKLIELQNNNYQNTIFGKVDTNSQKLSSISIFKGIVYTIIAIVVVLVIGWIVLSVKIKGIGQVLALGKLIKPSNAAPLQPSIVEEDEGVWQLLLVILFGIMILYFILKYISVFRKIYRNIAYPCFEVTPELLSNRQSVILYLSSLTNYCYIELDHFYASPHDITLIQSSTPINIELHKNCCSSYITILHTNLALQVGSDFNNVWSVSNTIPVPNYLSYVVESILLQHVTMELLIGCNNVYRAYPIIMQPVIANTESQS